MSKRSGSYRSLLRGVSQQPPEQRLAGQHTEQVNMLSDPVAGVTRRQGTTFVRASSLGTFNAADLAENFETSPIKVAAREFTLHTRRPGTSGVTAPVLLVRRGHAIDGALADVRLSTAALALLGAGINAHAVVGDYLVMAHTADVASSKVERWDTPTNRRMAFAQVRGGAYSRTFTVKVKLVGLGALTGTYTTPASTYGGVLNTSGVPYNAADYTKQVNDLVNAYNSAVTAHIGTAAAAIQPQAIAQSLVNALVGAGAGAQGISVSASNGVVYVTAPSDIELFEVYDGGDGSLLKGTWQEVPAAADLPPYCYTGKVVKVAPREGDSYYLKAESDTTGVAQVTWRECSAAEVALSNMFCIGIEHNDIWCIGASPADLETLLTTTHGSGHGVDVPEYGERNAGDDESNPVPHFVGRPITYLGVFQDRLLVGTDNVVNASLIGGYFSFFRTTALSTPDDDPVEMFATGTEGDSLRRGVIFDKSNILFGDSAQYAIPGTVPLTPATSNIMQSSRHINAASIAPLALGNIVFYVKEGDSGLSLHQINVGSVDDTSNSSEVSVQLDDYLHGRPGSMVGLSNPGCVVLHLRGRPRELFLFRYIDASNGERLLDAWMRWEFDAACGTIVGVSQYADRLRIHFVRDTRLVVDEVSVLSGDNTVPHLDSHGDDTRLVSPEGSAMHVAWPGTASATRRWQGNRAPTAAALYAELGYEAGLVAGLPMPGYFTPTPPVLRDQNDAPITTGELVVDSLSITFRDTGGLLVTVSTDWDDYQSARYIGRTIDAADNLVGQRALHRGIENAPIEQSTREYAATIRSIDWLPLSVTSIDWVGQYFNRTRRT